MERNKRWKVTHTPSRTDHAGEGSVASLGWMAREIQGSVPHVPKLTDPAADKPSLESPVSAHFEDHPTPAGDSLDPYADSLTEKPSPARRRNALGSHLEDDDRFRECWVRDHGY